MKSIGGHQMRALISKGLAVSILSAAFAAFSVSAQPESEVSQDARPWQTDQIAEHSHTSQPEGKPSNGPAVVPVDILRHPVKAKVRRQLLNAMEKMEAGDHERAIEQLLEILAKYPDSAAYVHNLLGVEYVKTDRLQAAISSFEQAVLLLPHVAMAHYSFGLALICSGNYDRATQEVQRALELDPKNTQIQMRLTALLLKRSSN
jgi:tetratricopeptide (TPR) repeat protein